MNDQLNVIVIGARPARQGIGEFVAGWFARCGARVTAVVGTSPDTVAQAQATLRERYAIDCRGYTDLAEALACEPGDVVAICSPYRLHAEHLELVGRAGRHCLCEKPLCWPAAQGENPVQVFVDAGTLLDVLTQWPCTLPTFFELHPDLAGAAVEQFEMRLSPISSGLDMVPDAVPHFISMIRALVGTQPTAREQWHVRGVNARFVNGDPRRLIIECDVFHARGATRATLHLETCPQRPRPAWYAINGARVEREVELTGYRQFFRSSKSRLPLPDPTGLLVGRFLADIAARRLTDRLMLDRDQELLTVFFQAAQAAGSGANP